MCGIFGLVAKNNKYKEENLISLIENLAKYSQTRGSDSAGFCYKIESDSTFNIIKSPSSVQDLLKSNAYKKYKSKIIDRYNNEPNQGNLVATGHARLVTNGTQLNKNNNQPIVKDGVICTHNGIIVNDSSLWEKYQDISKKFDIDTEIICSLFRYFLDKTGDSINAIKKLSNELSGTFSISLLIDNKNELIVYSNNCSLYTLTNNEDLFIFASEKNILNKLFDKNRKIFNDSFKIHNKKANSGCLINFKNFTINNIDALSETYDFDIRKIKYKVKYMYDNVKADQLDMVVDVNKNYKSINFNYDNGLLENNFDKISQLKRCSKCILPETFPFILFDYNGVCNYCNNYKKKNTYKPLSVLNNLVEPYRKKNIPDCLVPFSGGRDSTYVLHFVKKELNLNPIAYTYDWGMVTDLARRNIARVCGKLGVENIIVAADIKKKRRNIKLNIEAWLKKPSLGMIPLFMAGDKQFFKYANIIKKQNNIDLNIWGINFLENTDFKVGFCGVKPDWNKKIIYSMNLSRQLKLFSFVGQNIIKNTSYINSSLSDTMDSFLSRYLNPRKDYYHFFDYYQWDEFEIENLIKNEYNWELANDIKSTWRIGDGTASFYNYIYYTVAGFSEFDTFRSNQIRENMISRNSALKMIYKENVPRNESIKWYLDILGIDFHSTIKIINQIPKLY